MISYMKQPKPRTAPLALVLAACLALCGCTPPAPSAPATPAPDPWDEAGLHAALELCVSFGPGEAGVSLKTVIAACGMLDWAEDNPGSPENRTVTRSVEDWLGSKPLSTRQLFWENWPSIEQQAQEILDDPVDLAELLASAGNPQQHSSYTRTSYSRLCDCISACEDC